MELDKSSKSSKEKAKVGRDPPVIVFINGKSGGQQGARVKKKFLSILPDDQVFDLSEGGPEPGLKQWYEHRTKLRVVACGGDGTAVCVTLSGWVLSVLDKLGWKEWPAVCVLPLGTGNDLSRILRWGKGYAGEDLYEYVKQVEESTSVLPFDRWFVKYTPLSEEEIEKLIEERKNGGNDSDSEEDGSEVKSGSGKKKGLVRSASVRSDRSLKSSSSKAKAKEDPLSKSDGGVPDGSDKKKSDKDDNAASSSSDDGGKGKDKDQEKGNEEGDPDRSKLKEIVMNNYFSIGIDSQVCLDFHNLRESHPGLFRHKLINFGWYGMLATKSAMSSWQYLKKAIIVKVDGKRIHISKNIMAIVILNIPSYAGGTDLWGKSPKNFEPQTICDGLFEVVGIRGVNHMGMMQSGLSSGGQHIAQGKKVEIQMLYTLPVQVDGEPWIWPPANISVTWHNSAQLLFNTKKDKTGKKQKVLLEGRGGGGEEK